MQTQKIVQRKHRCITVNRTRRLPQSHLQSHTHTHTHTIKQLFISRFGHSDFATQPHACPSDIVQASRKAWALVRSMRFCTGPSRLSNVSPSRCQSPIPSSGASIALPLLSPSPALCSSSSSCSSCCNLPSFLPSAWLASASTPAAPVAVVVVVGVANSSIIAVLVTIPVIITVVLRFAVVLVSLAVLPSWRYC